MRVSRWPLLAVTTLLLATTPLFAQTPSNTETFCQQQPVTRALNGGFSVVVRATGGATPDQACEVLVRDRNGRTIFADRGFNTQIHPATGHDIDNDGRPDVVVGVDTGGGNRCCWEYPVISLGATPRVLLKLPAVAFDFETVPGRTLIWVTAVFQELGPDAADPPVVETVREFRANGFVDITPDYCKRMIAGELRGPGDLRDLLNALSLRSKQASRADSGSPFDREQTRLAALSMALQQIYCNRMEDASQLVLEVWPAREQAQVRKQIKDAVAGRWPELARKIAAW